MSDANRQLRLRNTGQSDDQYAADSDESVSSRSDCGFNDDRAAIAPAPNDDSDVNRSAAGRNSRAYDCEIDAAASAAAAATASSSSGGDDDHECEGDAEAAEAGHQQQLQYCGPDRVFYTPGTTVPYRRLKDAENDDDDCDQDDEDDGENSDSGSGQFGYRVGCKYTSNGYADPIAAIKRADAAESSVSAAEEKWRQKSASPPEQAGIAATDKGPTSDQQSKKRHQQQSRPQASSYGNSAADPDSNEPISEAVYYENIRGASSSKTNKRGSKRREQGVRVTLKAQDVAGNRGQDDIDSLLDFIESNPNARVKRVAAKAASQLQAHHQQQQKQKKPKEAKAPASAPAPEEAEQLLQESPPLLAAALAPEMPEPEQQPLPPLARPQSPPLSPPAEPKLQQLPVLLSEPPSDACEPPQKASSVGPAETAALPNGAIPNGGEAAAHEPEKLQPAQEPPPQETSLQKQQPQAQQYQQPPQSQQQPQKHPQLQKQPQLIFTDFDTLSAPEPVREAAFSVVLSKKERKHMRRLADPQPQQPHPQNQIQHQPSHHVQHQHQPQQQQQHRPPSAHSAPSRVHNGGPAVAGVPAPVSPPAATAAAARTSSSSRSLSPTASEASAAGASDSQRSSRPLNPAQYEQLLRQKAQENALLRRDLDSCSPNHSQLISFLYSLC